MCKKAKKKFHSAINNVSQSLWTFSSFQILSYMIFAWWHRRSLNWLRYIHICLNVVVFCISVFLWSDRDVCYFQMCKASLSDSSLDATKRTKQTAFPPFIHIHEPSSLIQGAVRKSRVLVHIPDVWPAVKHRDLSRHKATSSTSRCLHLKVKMWQLSTGSVFVSKQKKHNAAFHSSVLKCCKQQLMHFHTEDATFSDWCLSIFGTIQIKKRPPRT